MEEGNQVKAMEARDSSQLLDQQLGFASDGHQFLTFFLGDEVYGIEILRVQEIKGYTAVTHIPNTPEFIKGVLNLRGTIVPIIDLRLKFRMDSKEYDKTTVIIVVELSNRVMGIVVDAVSEVLSIPEKDVQPTPQFGSTVDVSFINGIGKSGEKLVTLLDIDRVMSVSEIEEAASVAASA